MSAPTPETHDTAAIAGRTVREISIALAASAVLLAIMLAAVLVADREAVAAVGVLALALSIGLTVLVVRRVARMSALRTEAITQEREGRERLDRTLAATRRFLEAESPRDLRRQICAVAREVFECAATSLWDVGEEDITLLERVPWVAPYAGSDRRAIAELPGLREALETGEPLYVGDLATQSRGATRATAEALGAGSLLNVPISVGGQTRLMLGLLWEERIPEPAGAGRIAPQRFADQAGLALEQARNRAAQAEIASLNRTLQAMVQTDPLFRADGTSEQVAEAVCLQALSVFEASGAALWVESGDGIDLVMRRPEAGVFAAHGHIAFAEHPAFAADLASGQPRFVADVEQDDPMLWERFARHSGSRSQLRLPLASAGQARALIILSWSRPVAPPSAEIAAVAARFADQAGAALAEAARREASRDVDEMHDRFERSLLPTIALSSRGAEVATFYRPGDDRLRLGGDFYDCVELAEGRIALLIGDVAGHGPAAAALGASLRSAWRALILSGAPLEDLAPGLQAVCASERHDPYMFVTAITAEVPSERNTLRFVSAGHPPPLVLGGDPLEPAGNGPPLGVVPDPRWPAAAVALPRAASILLYTDGLVEGRAGPHSPDRLGIGPIAAALATVEPGALTSAALRGAVEVATRAHGAGLADDVALLALNLRAD